MKRYRCVVQGGHDLNLIAVFVRAFNAAEAMATAMALYGPIVAFISLDQKHQGDE